MVTIMIEGVLFVAAIAALVALVAYGVLELTPLGRRIRQTENRRRIERQYAQGAALTCPVHGSHSDRDLVRLPGGTRICPECYAEAFRDESH